MIMVIGLIGVGITVGEISLVKVSLRSISTKKSSSYESLNINYDF